MEIYLDGSSVQVEGKWYGSNVFAVVGDNEVLWQEKYYQPGGTIGLMELRALLNAMEYVKDNARGHVDIYSDSEYVVKGATQWLEQWIKNDFLNVKHVMVWKHILMLQQSVLSLGVTVNIKWVKAHSGNLWNDYVDNEAKKYLGCHCGRDTSEREIGSMPMSLIDTIHNFGLMPVTSAGERNGWEAMLYKVEKMERKINEEFSNLKKEIVNEIKNSKNH